MKKITIVGGEEPKRGEEERISFLTNANELMWEVDCAWSFAKDALAEKYNERIGGLYSRNPKLKKEDFTLYISKFANLHVLDIATNFFEDRGILDEVLKIINLRKLVIECIAEYPSFFVQILKAMEGLEILEISCQLSNINLIGLAPHRNLKSLSYFKSSLSDQDLPTILENVPNLVKLCIQDNRLINPKFNNISEYPSLKVLDMADNGDYYSPNYKRSDDSLESLKIFTNLITLDLGRCNLRDIHLEGISLRHPKLKRLTLMGNPLITVNGLKNLKGLKLESLDIRYTLAYKYLSASNFQKLTGTITSFAKEEGEVRGEVIETIRKDTELEESRKRG